MACLSIEEGHTHPGSPQGKLLLLKIFKNNKRKYQEPLWNSRQQGKKSQIWCAARIFQYKHNAKKNQFIWTYGLKVVAGQSFWSIFELKSNKMKTEGEVTLKAYFHGEPPLIPRWERVRDWQWGPTISFKESEGGIEEERRCAGNSAARRGRPPPWMEGMDAQDLKESVRTQNVARDGRKGSESSSPAAAVVGDADTSPTYL